MQLRIFPNPAKATAISFLAMLILAFDVAAGDVTGTWKAEFDTQIGVQKYTFTLNEDGGKVKGKANVEG